MLSPEKREEIIEDLIGLRPGNRMQTLGALNRYQDRRKDLERAITLTLAAVAEEAAKGMSEGDRADLESYRAYLISVEGGSCSSDCARWLERQLTASLAREARELP